MNIVQREPNHICGNLNCKKGENGGRKHYYACDYCDRINTWKSFACSLECYAEVVNEQKASLPIRTDKTPNEVSKIYEKSIEEVKNETLEELSDLSDVIKTEGLSAAIDVINKDITANKTKAGRNVKKK